MTPNKRSAVKSIEYIGTINTVPEIKEFLESENALEKPRKTVLDAVAEREAFINTRNLEMGDGVEMVEPGNNDDDNPVIKEEEQKLVKGNAELAFEPQVVANKIFLKIAKGKSFIAKAESACGNADYIIKGVDDKQGIENVTKLKNAVRDIRKQIDNARKSETEAFREVTSLINTEFNLSINKAKQIESSLAERLKVISDAKEKIKAEAEEKARKALVQKELDEILAREEAIKLRETSLLIREQELKEKYGAIINKGLDKKAQRELEQPVDAINEPPAKPLSGKAIIHSHLDNITEVIRRTPETDDNAVKAMLDGINKNLNNIINHYASKLREE